MIDRAVGRRSSQRARGNLCVTDSPRAAAAERHAQRADGQFAHAAVWEQERHQEHEGQEQRPGRYRAAALSLSPFALGA